MQDSQRRPQGASRARFKFGSGQYERRPTSSFAYARQRTLQVKLFAGIAAIALLAIVALVGFSIRQHRSHMLDAIARDEIRRVMSQPLGDRQAMLTADEAVFGAFATKLMASPTVVLVRLGSARRPESWLVTRDNLANESGAFAVQRVHGSSYRNVKRSEGGTLEIAIPVGQLAMLNRPKLSEIRQPLDLADTLWIGIDATEIYKAAREAAAQTRDAQAVVAVLMMFGLWIMTRRVLRPIEKLVDDAEQIANGRDPARATASNSGEARRLHHALSTLAVNPHRANSNRSEALPEALGHATVKARPSATSTVASNYSALHPALHAPRQPSSAAPIDLKSARDYNYRVLLAEDNPVNRTVATDMLDHIGCTVEAAGDGVECLSRFDPECVDLIFMDIQMPKMDGLEATRKIRALEIELGVEPTPIIALTAHSEPRDLAACQRAGMNGHIAKPFRTRDLEQALLEWGRKAKSPESGD